MNIDELVEAVGRSALGPEAKTEITEILEGCKTEERKRKDAKIEIRNEDELFEDGNLVGDVVESGLRNDRFCCAS